MSAVRNTMSEDSIVLACEGLRKELEAAAENMQNCPQILYLPQGLHDEPDKMRQELNLKIAEIEEQFPQVTTIIMGYGLCGRGMCGVTARRARLIVPRVHDCVPLYVGVTQQELGMTDVNSGILWLSAGMLEYGQFASHLVETRHEKYREKFGEKRAAKMIQAENSLFANYKGVRYVRWSGMKEAYAELAQAVARELSLNYEEIMGQAAFLRDLLAGGHDERRFLTLAPGFGIDMDTTGEIIPFRL